jgi:hypothetical protein
MRQDEMDDKITGSRNDTGIYRLYALYALWVGGQVSFTGLRM